MFAFSSLTTTRSDREGSLQFVSFPTSRIVGLLKLSHNGFLPISHREISPQGGRGPLSDNPTWNVLYSSIRDELGQHLTFPLRVGIIIRSFDGLPTFQGKIGTSLSYGSSAQLFLNSFHFVVGSPVLSL